jgi:hypothetical protein
MIAAIFDLRASIPSSPSFFGPESWNFYDRTHQILNCSKKDCRERSIILQIEKVSEADI